MRFIQHVEQRRPAEPPTLRTPSDLMDGRTWTALNDAINDRVPLYPDAVLWKRKLEVRLLGREVIGQVAYGRDGWLFFLESFGRPLGSVPETAAAVEAIRSFEKSADASSRVIVVPAPDKLSVYPEYLSSYLIKLRNESQAQRDMIRDWFNESGKIERIDTWEWFAQAKRITSEDLYDPEDTHHSFAGSMVFARALIETISPGMWESDDVVEGAPEPIRHGLRNMAGLPGPVRVTPRMHIERPGVHSRGVWVDGLPLTDGRFRIDSTVRYKNSADHQSIVTGRTLVVFDSFIGIDLRPSLAEFFEDVTFIHWGKVAPGDLRDAVNDFDLVIVQTVERSARPRFAHYFGDIMPSRRNALLKLSDAIASER